MFNYRTLVWLAVATAVVWFLVLQTNRSLAGLGTLRVYFLDVGQGDATLLIEPDGQDILIDGGPSSAVLTELGEVLPPLDRKIEHVILTHPESDHLAGLIDVAERFEIGEVIVTGAAATGENFKNWQAILEEKNIPRRLVKAGDVLQFGEVKFEVYNPLEFYPQTKELNQTSIVGRFSFKENEVMTTGDAERDVLNGIANSNSSEALRSDILKVPHHGSNDSISEDFVKEVSPDYAIISVGKKNPYGHPRKETLNFYEKLKIKLFRTDQDGRIEADGDGKKWKIK